MSTTADITTIRPRRVKRKIDNPQFVSPEAQEAARYTSRKLYPEPPTGETWWSIYVADRYCILETMRANIAADLRAGYDPESGCIQMQVKDMQKYADDIRYMLDLMLFWDDDTKEEYCYDDLLERGAISA